MCAVPGNDDAQAELHRKFEAAISGMELSDLRQLTGDLSLVDGRIAHHRTRPELRRPQRDDVAIYRVRVDLDHAEPPIWRRLDLRSDLSLDVVHQVLQAAFGWTDSHLHRFSLGGHPFDRTSQLFLCPYDVENGEDEDDGGIAAGDVRLDETLQEPGDVVHYLYDYGDNWDVTIQLEKLLPAEPGSPAASAVDGRRAAPPEDSGGGTDLASLAMVVDDPAHFDLDQLNQALRGPHLVMLESGVDQRLVDLVGRLRHTPVGEDLAERMVVLRSQPTQPDHAELVASLAAHRWFLERAVDGGIELTSAGYLKPADVEAASAVVPTMRDWIGKNNREINTVPLLRFRESLQSMGLLRKYKGALLLTRAGAAAQRDPSILWRHLAERLIPAKAGDFETAATLLLLAYAGTSPGATVPRGPVTAALSELGWRHRDGRALDRRELSRLGVFDVLDNVGDRRATLPDRGRVSPAAATLARAALRTAR